jgi:hypothetical protein
VAFDPKYYIRPNLFAAYDGTNSADILAYPWTDPITLVSEVDGVLTVDTLVGQFEVNTGDIIIVTAEGRFDGSFPATGLSSFIRIEPAA